MVRATTHVALTDLRYHAGQRVAFGHDVRHRRSLSRGIPMIEFQGFRRSAVHASVGLQVLCDICLVFRDLGLPYRANNSDAVSFVLLIVTPRDDGLVLATGRHPLSITIGLCGSPRPCRVHGFCSAKWPRLLEVGTLYLFELSRTSGFPVPEYRGW